MSAPYDPDHDSYLQDDFDEELDPEGPSRDDIERFSGDERRCPSCDAEIFDETTVCPICGEMIADAPGTVPTVMMLAGTAVIVAIILVFVF